MSIQAAFARITALQSALTGPQPAPTPAVAPAAAPGAATAFAGSLQAAAAAGPAGASRLAAPAVAPASMTTGTPAGQAVLNLARSELGQAEYPPGGNDSPRIASYRQATAGSGVGPWCAYFTSWAAREAGVPLGEAGQGFGAVSEVWAWAQRSGKALPAASGIAPQPGDLIVWGGRHIGVVEAVAPDGSITTIEGNSSDAVNRRTYGPDGGGATGYVRLG